MDRIDLTGVDVVYQRSWSTLNLEETGRVDREESDGLAERGSGGCHLFWGQQMTTTDLYYLLVTKEYPPALPKRSDAINPMSSEPSISISINSQLASA